MSALFPSGLFSHMAIFMVFLRLMGWFAIMPAFSHSAIPARFKVLLAIVISFALQPVLRPYLAELPTDTGGIVAYAVRETAVGFLMGLVAFITFEGIHLAAQFIGYQMGFGSAGLLDPVTQSQVSMLVPLAGWMALMVFFLTNMHHHLLLLFVKSFEITGTVSFEKLSAEPLLKFMIDVSGRLFAVAIKIAAPITLLVLACNTAVGILARLLPQMQIILFAFPITILLGLVTLYILVPDLLAMFEGTLEMMWEDVLGLLRLL